MELLIEVKAPTPAPHPRLEVQVDVEPEVPVADLIVALRDHAAARGIQSLPPGHELTAVAEPGGRALHPDDSVVGARLVTGETVCLRLAPLGAANGAGHRPDPNGPNGPSAGNWPNGLSGPTGSPGGAPGPQVSVRQPTVAPPGPAPAPGPGSGFGPPGPGAPGPGPGVGPASGFGAGLPSTPSDAPAARVERPPMVAPTRPAQATAAQQARSIAMDIGTGPSAGMSKLLGPGRYAVGRGQGCSIRLADPTVSRLHMTVEVTDDLEVYVHDNPESTNGTWVNGDLVLEARAVQSGEHVVLGASEITFWPVVPDESPTTERLGQVPFNRVPYKRPVVQERPFEALDSPPKKPDPKKISILGALVPLVGATIMWQVTGRWFMLIFAGMAPITMFVRRRSSKKQGNLKYRRQRDEFIEQLDQRVEEIDAAIAVETRERFAASPDVAELARQADLRQRRLWERHRGANDFLDLRLGLGDQESLIKQDTVKDKDSDLDLREMMAERIAHHNVVPHVPVSADLDKLGAVGLFNDLAQVNALGAAMVTQAACLHSPEDLVLAAAVSPNTLSRWAWLKWLPHTRTATSPLDGEHLVVGSDDLNRMMANLLKVAAARIESKVPAEHQWPRVLVVIDEEADPDRAILAQLLDVAPAVGIRMLWLGHTDFQLPRQCKGIVRCVDPRDGESTLRYTDPDIPDQQLMLEGINAQTALDISRKLAPIRDASATSLTTAIPRKALLLDSIGMVEPGPQEIVHRWAQDRGYSLGFTLGVDADGQFNLDMVSDGPHALIAGTSGAGKSELLQSMVAALAANYPPERLNLLFIDYKGGAAAAPFEPLPHTVGAVTNLEAQLSMRALTSLRAELNRRMAVMEGRAKDLAEMIEVAPTEAPPSLVIVVDEFATLVKEIPEFVVGMVDIAQRGRSLGIHLVLATQRPTGAVNDNILANTNLRMSLRVMDPADSNAIIGVRDAADLPVPLRGRAYARSGPGAITPFQCAYSGAPFERKETAAAVSVRPFPFGEHTPDANEESSAKQSSKPPPGAGGNGEAEEEEAPPTHLEVVVNACADAAKKLQKPPPRRPWVEPLPEVVLLDDIVAKLDLAGGGLSADPGRYAILGLADQPEAQSQRPEVVDLEGTGGLLVFGSGGVGKTTTLRTVAAGMAAQGDPDGVEIYAMDFAGRSLDQLKELPHTVSVATTEDMELITRTFTVLRGEIARRRDLLAEHRAESLSALRHQVGGLVMPRIILMLDSYSNFHSTFDKSGDLFAWLQALQKLVADGRQVGIHAVFATDRRQGLPSSLFSAMGSRLALRMSTPEELTQVGVPSKIAKEVNMADGRAYLDGAVELQVACVSEDAGGSAQAAALAEIGERVRDRSDARPNPLPELPEQITVEQLPSGRLRIPIGITDLTMEVAEVDLSRQNLVVTGPPMSGRSTAVATAARALAAAPDAPALVGIGGATSPLSELDVWTHAGFSRSQVVPALEAAVELVGEEETSAVSMVLFIDAVEDVDGTDRAKLLEKLAKSDAVRLVVAADAMTLSKSYSGWTSELRRNRAVMYFQPQKGEVDGMTGMKPSLRPNQPMPAGRGVLVADRNWRLIQVSVPPELATMTASAA